MSLVTCDDTQRAGVLLLTLNRVERHNALSKPLLVEFERSLSGAAGDPAVRCIVITGAGTRAFCAGADIREQEGFSSADAYAHMRYGQQLFDQLAATPMPTIAAINGFALGGGLELALACDVRIASAAAEVSFPEVTLASLPGWGGTQRLSRLIGPSAAKLVIMSGRRLAAAEALRLGIVDEVQPEPALLSAVLDLAATLAEHEPGALRAIKRVIDDGLGLPWDEALDMEARSVAGLWGTPAQKAAQAAFFSRRKAGVAARAE